MTVAEIFSAHGLIIAFVFYIICFAYCYWWTHRAYKNRYYMGHVSMVDIFFAVMPGINVAAMLTYILIDINECCDRAKAKKDKREKEPTYFADRFFGINPKGR